MLSSIKLRIGEKLRNKGYRHRFFRGRTQDEVAYQLRLFRKRRGLSQQELERKSGMKQSAISRLEQASYSRWGIQTLFRLAEILDFRVRVVIDASEDAIKEYERIEAMEEFGYFADQDDTQRGSVQAESTTFDFLAERDRSAPPEDAFSAKNGTGVIQ